MKDPQLVPRHVDYDSLDALGYARPILARAFSVVNIHLIRAHAALRCRCQLEQNDEWAVQRARCRVTKDDVIGFKDHRLATINPRTGRPIERWKRSTA